jgi:hypothetical protein
VSCGDSIGPFPGSNTGQPLCSLAAATSSAVKPGGRSAGPEAEVGGVKDACGIAGGEDIVFLTPKRWNQVS